MRNHYTGHGKKNIDDVMTISEACMVWNLSECSIRQSIKRGRFNDDEIRKSKGTWLITQDAMLRVTRQWFNVNV
jgi:hypothetical protein